MVRVSWDGARTILLKENDCVVIYEFDKTQIRICMNIKQK